MKNVAKGFLVFLIFLGGWLGWRDVSSIPNYMAIEVAYYVCEEKRVLKGGIVGKGPFISLPGKEDWCWKWNWKKVSREEFKDLAVKWHSKDWEEEIIWWQN